MPMQTHNTKGASFTYNTELSGKVKILVHPLKREEHKPAKELDVSLDDLVDFLEQCVVIPTIVDQVRRSTLYELIHMR